MAPIKNLLFLVQLGNYSDKAVNIIKVTIYRSKSDICHLIYILQPSQYQLTDLVRRYLTSELVLQLLYNILNHFFKVFDLYRTFYCSSRKPVYQLVTVKRFMVLSFLQP